MSSCLTTKPNYLNSYLKNSKFEQEHNQYTRNYLVSDDTSDTETIWLLAFKTIMTEGKMKCTLAQDFQKVLKQKFNIRKESRRTSSIHHKTTIFLPHILFLLAFHHTETTIKTLTVLVWSA